MDCLLDVGFVFEFEVGLDEGSDRGALLEFVFLFVQELSADFLELEET